jgi:hypothetical protein
MKDHATDEIFLQILMRNGEMHTVPIEYYTLGGIAIISHLGEAPVMGMDVCTHCAVEKFAKEYVKYHNA